MTKVKILAGYFSTFRRKTKMSFLGGPIHKVKFYSSSNAAKRFFTPAKVIKGFLARYQILVSSG